MFRLHIKFVLHCEEAAQHAVCVQLEQKASGERCDSIFTTRPGGKIMLVIFLIEIRVTARGRKVSGEIIQRFLFFV